MKVTIVTHPQQQVSFKENARAYEVESGCFTVLAELLNASTHRIDGVRAYVVLKGALADLIAIEEVMIGSLHPEERRPLKVHISPSGREVSLVQLYLTHELTQ